MTIEERDMSHWIMGILAALFGLVGLFMASGARDTGILGFGLALSLFAVLFCWWMIKLSYDEAEQATDNN
jgi:uncharacterized membrane protein